MLQGHPKGITQKGHPDVGLDPRFLLMEQRPDRKLALERAKRRLGFSGVACISTTAPPLSLPSGWCVAGKRPPASPAKPYGRLSFPKPDVRLRACPAE